MNKLVTRTLLLGGILALLGASSASAQWAWRWSGWSPPTTFQLVHAYFGKQVAYSVNHSVANGAQSYNLTTNTSHRSQATCARGTRIRTRNGPIIGSGAPTLTQSNAPCFFGYSVVSGRAGIWGKNP